MLVPAVAVRRCVQRLFLIHVLAHLLLLPGHTTAAKDVWTTSPANSVSCNGGDPRAVRASSLLQVTKSRARTFVTDDEAEHADGTNEDATVEPSGDSLPSRNGESARASPLESAFANHQVKGKAVNQSLDVSQQAVLDQMRSLMAFANLSFPGALGAYAHSGAAVHGAPRWAANAEEQPNLKAVLAGGLILSLAFVAAGLAACTSRRTKRADAERPDGTTDTKTVLEWAIIHELGGFSRRAPGGMPAHVPELSLNADGDKVYPWCSGAESPTHPGENRMAHSSSDIFTRMFSGSLSSTGCSSRNWLGSCTAEDAHMASSSSHSELQLSSHWEPESEH